MIDVSCVGPFDRETQGWVEVVAVPGRYLAASSLAAELHRPITARIERMLHFQLAMAIRCRTLPASIYSRAVQTCSCGDTTSSAETYVRKP